MIFILILIFIIDYNNQIIIIILYNYKLSSNEYRVTSTCRVSFSPQISSLPLSPSLSQIQISLSLFLSPSQILQISLPLPLSFPLSFSQISLSLSRTFLPCVHGNLFCNPSFNVHGSGFRVLPFHY